MKTANDYARDAVEITALSERMRPHNDSAYRGVESLIVYHLRVAASDARKISEALAKTEAGRK